MRRRAHRLERRQKPDVTKAPPCADLHVCIPVSPVSCFFFLTGLLVRLCHAGEQSSWNVDMCRARAAAFVVGPTPWMRGYRGLVRHKWPALSGMHQEALLPCSRSWGRRIGMHCWVSANCFSTLLITMEVRARLPGFNDGVRDKYDLVSSK